MFQAAAAAQQQRIRLIQQQAATVRATMMHHMMHQNPFVGTPVLVRQPFANPAAGIRLVMNDMKKKMENGISHKVLFKEPKPFV